MRETLGYDKNHDGRENNDFYATPPEEVTNIIQFEELYETILEPCCGLGHMVRGIEEAYGNRKKILATDLVDRGFGRGGLDFLSPKYPFKSNINTIIMNPPFKHIQEFTLKALEIAKKKVVLFARLQFMESQTRYENIFKDNKPTRIYIYADRVACAKGGDFKQSLDSSMAFGWFVWDKINPKEKSVNWIRRWDKQEKEFYIPSRT